MATKTEMITLVQSLLQISTSSLSSEDTEEAIDAALLHYSKDLPRDIYGQFAGQGEYNYDIANVLDEWIDDFSVIKDIEYPVGSQSPEEIEDIDWEVYDPDSSEYTISTASSAATSVTTATAAEALFFQQYNVVYIADDSNNEINWASANGNTTTGEITLKNALSNAYTGGSVKQRKALRFLGYTPSSSEVVLVRYTTIHALTDSVDTIPTANYRAFSYLCASLAALMISAKYAKSSNSSIGADSVDYLSKVDEWRKVSEYYLDQYQSNIGIPADGTPLAASQTKDWDTFFAWGSDYLFHNRRWQ